jgi:hypothetical protein
MLLESTCDRRLPVCDCKIAQRKTFRLADLAAGTEPSQPDCDPSLLQEVHSLFDVDGSLRNRERSRRDS